MHAEGARPAQGKEAAVAGAGWVWFGLRVGVGVEGRRGKGKCFAEALTKSETPIESRMPANSTGLNKMAATVSKVSGGRQCQRGPGLGGCLEGAVARIW